MRFTIDTTQPAISIITPANNTFTSDTLLDVNYTASDLGTGISSCWYSNDTMSLNTTQASCANITTITWANGQHNVTIWVNDTANNVNSSSVRFTIDTINPSSTIGKNTSQVELGSGAININWTATDTNLGNVIFNVTYPNNTILFSSTSSTGNINLSSPANLSLLGTYTVNLFANDSVNNINLTSTTFLVNDTIYPLASIIYPQNTTYSINVSNLNYTYLDTNTGVCWYSRDNGVTNSSTQTPSLNFTNVISTEGSNTWKLYCNDTAGNLNTSSITFFKDTINPLIDYGTGTANSSTYYSRNWIYVNVSVTESNFKNITFYLFNITGLVNSTTYTAQTYNINFTSLIDGNYSINATIYDTLENFNSTSTRTSIILDATAPAINFTSPTETNNSYIGRNNTLVNVTSTDANLANITVNLYN